MYTNDPASSVSVDIPEAVGGDAGVTYYKIRVRVGQGVRNSLNLDKIRCDL